MRVAAAFLLFIFLAIMAGRDARAEPRVALVIGNGAYSSISPLANARRDARLMAKTLKRVGFDVVEAFDSDLKGMRSAVRTFGKKLRGAGNDAVGLFYYAGHGVRSAGENHLVPIAAQIEDEADFNIEAISAADILSHMDSAGNSTNIMVLDACRNNPYRSRSRSASRGLARVQSAGGTLLAFSAAPGQAAVDGEGRHSPYTRALAEAILTPGLQVEQVFKRVRVKVETDTGGKQTPWEESSLRGDFYFVPPLDAAPEPNAQDETAEPSDIVLWNALGPKHSEYALKEYLRRFPGGAFSQTARSKLASLSAKEDAAALPTPAHAPATQSPERALHLVRDIQTQLKRLGCYRSRPDNVWGPRSRRGLRQFARSTGTSLASLKPSAELLDRLQAHAGKACVSAVAAKPSSKTQVRSKKSERKRKRRVAKTKPRTKPVRRRAKKPPQRARRPRSSGTLHKCNTTFSC